MTSAAASPEVLLLFRIRDEMGAELARINQRLEEVDRTANRTSNSFRRNNDSLAGYSRTLLIFGATALSVASSVSRLAGQMGLLNQDQERALTTMISTVGAISALAGGIARLIPLIVAISKAERTRAIISAMGSVAGVPIVGVALALAAGAAIGAATYAVMSHQMGTGQRHQIPGATTQSRLAMVHGGEVISRPNEGGGGSAGGTVNVTFSGVFTGNESEFRGLARKFGRYFQEEKRIGGLTI